MDSSIEKLVEIIHKKLISKKQTVAVAESCTGGLLSVRFTDRAGISDVFLGGIVSYHNDVKRGVLQVSSQELQTHGAVSQQVALKMAQGVRQQLKSTWSVSITGVAGPGGGSPNKPVGTVWFAVVGPNIERVEHQLFQGDRATIRTRSVQFALEMLEQSLRES